MIPARDIFFGKLVRLLAALNLEMHQNRNGSIYVCPRRRRSRKWRPPLVVNT